jgi:hypothetical protein
VDKVIGDDDYKCVEKCDKVVGDDYYKCVEKCDIRSDSDCEGVRTEGYNCKATDTECVEDVSEYTCKEITNYDQCINASVALSRPSGFCGSIFVCFYVF